MSRHIYFCFILKLSSFFYVHFSSIFYYYYRTSVPIIYPNYFSFYLFSHWNNYFLRHFIFIFICVSFYLCLFFLSFFLSFSHLFIHSFFLHFIFSFYFFILFFICLWYRAGSWSSSIFETCTEHESKIINCGDRDWYFRDPSRGNEGRLFQRANSWKFIKIRQ